MENYKVKVLNAMGLSGEAILNEYDGYFSSYVTSVGGGGGGETLTFIAPLVKNSEGEVSITANAFVTPTALTTTLNSYVTNTSLATSLANYVTNTTLGNYTATENLKAKTYNDLKNIVTAGTGVTITTNDSLQALVVESNITTMSGKTEFRSIGTVPELQTMFNGTFAEVDLTPLLANSTKFSTIEDVDNNGLFEVVNDGGVFYIKVKPTKKVSKFTPLSINIRGIGSNNANTPRAFTLALVRKDGDIEIGKTFYSGENGAILSFNETQFNLDILSDIETSLTDGWVVQGYKLIMRAANLNNGNFISFSSFKIIFRW